MHFGWKLHAQFLSFASSDSNRSIQIFTFFFVLDKKKKFNCKKIYADQSESDGIEGRNYACNSRSKCIESKYHFIIGLDIHSLPKLYW